MLWLRRILVHLWLFIIFIFLTTPSGTSGAIVLNQSTDVTLASGPQLSSIRSIICDSRISPCRDYDNWYGRAASKVTRIANRKSPEYSQSPLMTEYFSPLLLVIAAQILPFLVIGKRQRGRLVSAACLMRSSLDSRLSVLALQNHLRTEPLHHVVSAASRRNELHVISLSIFRKVFLFLVFMVLILPSLGLTR